MENYQAWAEEVLEKVKEKMVWVSEKNKDIIPYTTDANGNYDCLLYTSDAADD